MFEIAKDPKVWERVRNDEAFARHREEIKKLYEKSYKKSPRASTAKYVLNYPNAEGGADHFNQLQTSALLALIYPENEDTRRCSFV